MSNGQTNIQEQVSGFNAFSVEIRERIVGLTKQVLVVSGSIQTLTIGAFLTGTPPKIPIEAVANLQDAWRMFSISIVLSLLLLFFQVLGLVHVGIKQKNKIEKQVAGVEIMNTWMPLRVLNWLVGLGAFFSCLLGVILITSGAIKLIA